MARDYLNLYGPKPDDRPFVDAFDPATGRPLVVVGEAPVEVPADAPAPAPAEEPVEAPQAAQ